MGGERPTTQYRLITMNNTVKHDAITVRSCRLFSGITGSFATNFSV